jgi:polyhydroxyalkanoate synthesis regulator phasin
MVTGALLTLTLAEPILAQAGEIKERQKHQEKRIDQGVKSGELTKGETLKLEAEQAKIRRKKRRFKRNDGEIGPKERAKLEQEQDKASKHIYKEKHDAQTR